MQGYIVFAIGIRFFTDTMLFMGVNKLSGVYANPCRSLLGAVISCLYAVCSFLPNFSFLNGVWYQLLFLLLSCWGAFSLGTWDRWLLFCLIKISIVCLASDLGGIVNLLSAAVLCGICAWAIGGRRKRYFPVELSYGSQSIQIKALYDSGNLLRDPVTGKSVLIVGADVAQKLTGLSIQQLENPVETMGQIPGLRLIPYRTVTQSEGFLLALRIQNTKIGKWQGSSVVAFAPRKLDGSFQALIGGIL